MEAQIKFLPYLKNKLPFPLSGGGKTLTLNPAVVDNANQRTPVREPIVITVRGPEHVTGINPNTISRHEPKPDTNDFEPNYFPFLEFRNPALLWLYTQHDLTAIPDKLEPWLSLVVISQTEIDNLCQQGISVISPIKDRQRYLTAKAGLLPVSGISWASAHVQANGLTSDVPISQFLTDDPSRIYCRLLCFRRLEPVTQYNAFLVPNFKASVNAAFGQTYKGRPVDLAWDSTLPEDIIKLPIYHQFSFSTSEFGDFEYLARKLTPTAADPKKIGTRAVDANLLRNAVEKDPTLYFLREGVLTVPGFEDQRDNFSKGSQPLPFTDGLKDLLNQSLNAVKTEAATGEPDPLLTFPVYGKLYKNITELSIPADGMTFPAPAPWLHELNLDFRNRVLAAFGGRAILDNREKFLKKAWNQVGDQREVNNEIRKSKAAMLIAREIHRKHVQPLTDERFTLFTAPFHGYVPINDVGKSKSVKKQFCKSGISPGLITSAFRKIAQRRIGINQVDLFAPWKSQRVKQSTIIPVYKIDKDLKLLLTQLPQAAKGVRTHAAELIPFEPINIKEIRRKFKMDKAILTRLQGTIRFNDGRTLNPDLDLLKSFLHLDLPMYKPLVDQSKDYFLPGLENLQHNAVTMLQENRRAIEAYMVSCNDHMVRTALFNQLFLDPRSTIFRYFWDSVTKRNPPPDLENIHLWSGPLGSNEPGENAANLVMLIKGDLIRRYPETIFYTQRIIGKSNFWSSVYGDASPPLNGDEQSEVIHPVFRARVSADILCVGFPYTLHDVSGETRDGEYYIVLQENSDLPRFGLDVATRLSRTPGTPETDDLSWADIEHLTIAQNIAEFHDDLFKHNGIKNSATIAYSTYQLPTRVPIHISHLLKK